MLEGMQDYCFSFFSVVVFFFDSEGYRGSSSWYRYISGFTKFLQEHPKSPLGRDLWKLYLKPINAFAFLAHQVLIMYCPIISGLSLIN